MEEEESKNANAKELVDDEHTNKTKNPEFKKPILVGKIGRLPKRMQTSSITREEDSVSLDIPPGQPEEIAEISEDSRYEGSTCSSDQQNTEMPYKEPLWSSIPHTTGKAYILEVLKSGAILEEINLMNKSCWIFGRSANCDIPLAHPTVSRYHAVLQYRGQGTEKDPVGFYIYDLGSTHGTFLNKGHLKSRIYAPVRVGHIIKFGFSSRSFLLTGPEEDAEEESEFTVTELKQKRAEKLLLQELAEKEALLKEQQEIEEKRKKEEERGIDWGLGEDAEEEQDLTENPYAQTNNEELYIEDPKKALRGFMEREGFNLDYDCTEHSFGQFLCKVELPLDDEHGRPIIAEVLHKGKKKEAVVQCALEACRILDRHGVLRQATHESRKRKAKNWEENDYYDSDDDTFLDRTGTVEKKREKRMKAKLPQQPETYQSLLEKEKKIREQILKIEKELSLSKFKSDNQSSITNDEDALDSYMKELKDSKPNKQNVSKLKADLARLRADHASVVKLANLAKPTDLPPLVISKPLETSASTGKKVLPIFGKRLKTKLQLPIKPVDTKPLDNACSEEEDDEDVSSENIKDATKNENSQSVAELSKTNNVLSDIKEISNTHVATQDVSKTDDNKKILNAKTKIGIKLHHATPSDDEDEESEDDDFDGRELTLEELKKRQKRNQRRIKQRRDKALLQKEKGYEEDAQKEDYNMWIPPSNQTGDGRTSLNAKFGY